MGWLLVAELVVELVVELEVEVAEQVALVVGLAEQVELSLQGVPVDDACSMLSVHPSSPMS